VAGVGGVDVFRAPGEAAEAAGRDRPGVDAAAPDRRPAALVDGIGDDPDLGGVQPVDQAVLAGGTQVVPCARQRG
jgi:hypothetical protein